MPVAVPQKQRQVAWELSSAQPLARSSPPDPGEELDGTLASLNKLQSSKVQALMRSIDQLQKENLTLRRRGQEQFRTAQFQQMQGELGRQDAMIEALRRTAGDEKARGLVRKAVAALDSAPGGCVGCKAAKDELFGADDGAVLCRTCYSLRYWGPPPSRKLEEGARPLLPASREELQDELDTAARQLLSLRRSARSAREAAQESQSAKASASAESFVSTAAALASLLAGLEQRASQLTRENSSLDEQRAALERAVEEQGYL
ncbi:unnamed protein product, partial [Polarella glacialis]